MSVRGSRSAPGSGSGGARGVRGEPPMVTVSVAVSATIRSQSRRTRCRTLLERRSAPARRSPASRLSRADMSIAMRWTSCASRPDIIAAGPAAASAACMMLASPLASASRSRRSVTCSSAVSLSAMSLPPTCTTEPRRPPLRAATGGGRSGLNAGMLEPMSKASWLSSSSSVSEWSDMPAALGGGTSHVA